jgi:hypothetical protein
MVKNSLRDFLRDKLGLSETDAAEIAHYLASTLVAIPEGSPSADALLFGYFELIAEEAGRIAPGSNQSGRLS